MIHLLYSLLLYLAITQENLSSTCSSLEQFFLFFTEREFDHLKSPLSSGTKLMLVLSVKYIFGVRQE
jgi:hypothetical protein